MKEIEKFLKDRFGIEKIPDEYVLINRGDIWIANKDVLNVKENLKFNRIGIRLIRVFKDGYKLTTSGSQIIGNFAKKNVLSLLSEEEVKKFISGEDIEGNFENMEKGQVIVKFNNDILGVALYDGEKLKNQIPKSKRIKLG
jgi:16S rRNA (cytosine1407-C5)-methyltransferase